MSSSSKASSNGNKLQHLGGCVPTRLPQKASDLLFTQRYRCPWKVGTSRPNWIERSVINPVRGWIKSSPYLNHCDMIIISNDIAHREIKTLMRQGKNLDIRIDESFALISTHAVTGLQYMLTPDNWNNPLNFTKASVSRRNGMRAMLYRLSISSFKCSKAVKVFEVSDGNMPKSS